MKSSNPVFNRSEAFNGRVDPNTTYPGAGGYADFGQAPATHQVPGSVQPGRMSIDSVVQKTGITLGVLLIAAAATWLAAMVGSLFVDYLSLPYLCDLRRAPGDGGRWVFIAMAAGADRNGRGDCLSRDAADSGKALCCDATACAGDA